MYSKIKIAGLPGPPMLMAFHGGLSHVGTSLLFAVYRYATPATFLAAIGVTTTAAIGFFGWTLMRDYYPGCGPDPSRNSLTTSFSSIRSRATHRGCHAKGRGAQDT